MAKLKDFPASSWAIGNALPDWEAAPCGSTNDSGPLEASNFDSMCDRFDDLDPMGVNWEIVRFAHWGTKWVEIVFYAPGSDIEQEALQIRGRLGDAICLDPVLMQEYAAADEQAKADFEARKQGEPIGAEHNEERTEGCG